MPSVTDESTGAARSAAAADEKSDRMRSLTHCPSCGRYIGPVETCPYCRVRVGKRRSVVGLKYGSLAFALVGILLLHQLAVHTDNPTMDVADLERQNNYGKIVIEGFVSDSPRYYESDFYDTGTLYFNVDDGTGIILVKAYSSATKEMFDDGNLPAFGDRVRVEGNFQYRGDDKSLILDTSEHLTIYRDEPVELSLETIRDSRTDPNAFTEGMRVRVRGTVVGDPRSYDPENPGFEEPTDLGFAFSLHLEDEEGNRVNVFVPGSVMELTGEGYIRDLWPGDDVEVTGALMYYSAGSYSRWELIPTSSDSVVVYRWNAEEPPEGWEPPAADGGGGGGR